MGGHPDSLDIAQGAGGVLRQQQRLGHRIGDELAGEQGLGHLSFRQSTLNWMENDGGGCGDGRPIDGTQKSWIVGVFRVAKPR